MAKPVDEKDYSKPVDDTRFILINAPEDHLRAELEETTADRDTCDHIIKMLKQIRDLCEWKIVLRTIGERSPLWTEGIQERIKDVLLQWMQIREKSVLPYVMETYRLMGDALLDDVTLYRCLHCGRIGEAARSDKKYCDSTCRANAHQGVDVDFEHSIIAGDSQTANG